MSAYNLYSLASPSTRQLMQLADVERFAVDDCIILTNSHDFAGWSRSKIKTTILSTRCLFQMTKLIQEKLPGD